MTRVPTTIGLAKGGKPKASEWLSFYTVYLVLSTIPEKYESPLAECQIICTSLIQLVKITNNIFARTFSHEDGETLQQDLQSYRQHLHSHWKNVSIKPNIHMAQHLPEVARQFGPLPDTAAWTGEHSQGIMGNINKNNHKGTFHLFLSFIAISFKSK